MGVFSNVFAAVDVREELCYHSRPEKANSRGVIPSLKRQISSPEIVSIKICDSIHIIPAAPKISAPILVF